MNERMPRYMMKEEGKKDKMRTRLGWEAVRYEERLESGGGRSGRGDAGEKLSQGRVRKSRSEKS